MQKPIAIIATKRTPIGQYQGCFSGLSATDLGQFAIQGTLENHKSLINQINEVYMGCVLPAGLGQAPARQAAIKAGLAKNIGATTINKMCGSGMKAIMLAQDSINAGTNNLVLAGGMESMTNAPYLLLKARSGYRMGHDKIYDHMFLDGLEDAYDKGQLMGVFAEMCAAKYNFTRTKQDEFAINSLKQANEAREKNYFKEEITPIEVTNKKDSKTIQFDELPLNAKPEKIPNLKPAFKQDGTVTAANSSAISDGACAHLLASQEFCAQNNITPIANIIGSATFAGEPKWFTTAPIGAINNLLEKLNWQINDIDLFEINEAFAVVTMAAITELELPKDKVNIHGGACALGHPIGASGARILTSLIYALKQNNLKRGIAALCIGGGEACAIGVEV